MNKNIQRAKQYWAIHGKKILVGALIALLGYILVGESERLEIAKAISSQNKVTTTKQIQDELCETPKQDVKYMVQTNDLLKNSNFIMLDLSTFNNFKIKRVSSTEVGYYYKRVGAVAEYYTVLKYEPRYKIPNNKPYKQ